jgi:hypothetical protein
MLHPNISVACGHGLGETSLLRQCVDAFFQQTRSVDGHVDKRHGVRCLYAERRSLTFDIHLPNQIGEQGSSYQRFVQHGFGSHEIEQKHQTYS